MTERAEGGCSYGLDDAINMVWDMLGLMPKDGPHPAHPPLALGADPLMAEATEQAKETTKATSNSTSSAAPSEKPREELGTWLIHFEDADMPDEVFTDRVAARLRYEHLNESWNCTMFAAIHPASIK